MIERYDRTVERALRACRRAALLITAGLVGNACQPSSLPPHDDARPAGLVKAVSGSVSARRASTTTSRTLALDAPVFADDTVTTGPDSTVEIALRHNNAIWSLGAKQSTRVDASIAWLAPREGGGDVQLVRDDTEDSLHAAGRHGAHEGMDSAEAAIKVEETTRLDDGRNDDQRPPPVISPEQAEAEKAKAEHRAKLREDVAAKGLLQIIGSKGNPDSVGDILKQQPNDGDSPFNGLGGVGGGPTGTAVGIASTPTPSATYKATTTYDFDEDVVEGDLKKPDGLFLEPHHTVGGGSVTAGTAPHGLVQIGETSFEPKDAEAEYRAEVRKRADALRRCVETAWRSDPAFTGTVRLAFTISTNGSVSDARDSSVQTEISACIQRTARAFRFDPPHGKKPVDVLVEIHALPAEAPEPAASPAKDR